MRTPAKRKMNHRHSAEKNKLPAEIVKILGPPPILVSEDEDLYYATLARFAKEFRPNDMTDWFLVKDLADLRVEIARCRRIKKAVLEASKDKSANNLTLQMLVCGSMQVGQARAGEEPKNKLKKSAATLTDAEKSGKEEQWAELVSSWIDDYSKLDRLLESAER